MKNTSKTPKGSLTRARILAEARALLVEGGYDAVALREVAKRAAIKLGNLQYYFATRDALLIALIEAEAVSDIDNIGKAFDGPDTSQAALRKTVHGLITRWMGSSGTVFATLNYLSTQRPVFRALHRRIYRKFYGQLEKAIEQADPGHSKEEYANRALLLAALIDGAPIQAIAGNKQRLQRIVANQAVNIALPPSSLT